MSEQSAVVEATPTVMDASRGPLVDLTPEQRTEFRTSGELPKPAENAASASADASEKTEESDTGGESETPRQQEKPSTKPKLTAEERIAEIQAKAEKTIRDIRKGAGIKETEVVESSPAKPEPKTEPVQQQPQYTRPKPTPEGNGPDGKPYETYEDYIEDLSDWKGEQREVNSKREAAMQERADRTHAKVEEAKTRYKDFGEVVGPAIETIIGDAKISPVVKEMLDDSDVFADLVYTIASDPAELAKFVKMAKDDPGKAIRYIALTESLIADELAGKTAETEATPVKPITKAPRPPSEAGGRAASPPDALDAAAKANDFRSFKAEATRRALASMKG